MACTSCTACCCCRCGCCCCYCIEMQSLARADAASGRSHLLPRSGVPSTTDPLLSFISSHLGTHSRTSSHQQLAPINSGGSGRSGTSSGRLELGTNARLWEAQWPELALQHLLGRGSFGSVYLAEWNQISVAVKVLVSRGERTFCLVWWDEGEGRMARRRQHSLLALCPPAPRRQHSLLALCPPAPRRRDGIANVQMPCKP